MNQSHGHAAEKPATGIVQFCADHGISRSHFYALQREGRAPRLMRIGRRILVSAEAAAEWRRRMENETEAEAAEARNDSRRKARKQREAA